MFCFFFVQAEYSNCVNKLEKDLVSNYQSQFENLFKAEAPTWETHGNLMVIMRFICLGLDYLLHVVV